MFAASREAVVGADVASAYGLKVGDSIITSHGLEGNGSSHAEAPLTIVGILERTNTGYDGAVFTPVQTIWELHDHGEHDEDEHAEEDHAEEEEEHDHEHAEEGTICAVLVRSKDFSACNSLMSAYSESGDYLAINPNTVLREVLDNVDMTKNIVYILCAVILVMNIFVISMIALLNAYDSKKEIQLMRLIGISMKRINLLYILQNAITNAAALLLSLIAAHACLAGIRSYVASMGIVLDAMKVYPLEWGIAALVFVVSLLPTTILTARMAGQDGIDR